MSLKMQWNSYTARLGYIKIQMQTSEQKIFVNRVNICNKILGIIIIYTYTVKSVLLKYYLCIMIHCQMKKLKTRKSEEGNMAEKARVRVHNKN